MSQEKVALITEEERATVTFLAQASSLGIGVTNVLEFKAENNRSLTQVVNYINGLGKLKSVQFPIELK